MNVNWLIRQLLRLARQRSRQSSQRGGQATKASQPNRQQVRGTRMVLRLLRRMFRL